MLKILSLNILCGTFLRPLPIFRLYKQINKIKEINPDIICLQEFNNPLIEFIYKKELKEYNFFIERVPIKELLRRTSVLTFYGLLFNYFHVISLYLVVVLYPYIFNFIIGTQKTGNTVFWKKNVNLNSFEVEEFKEQKGDFLNIMRRRGYVKFNINDLSIINTHLDHIGKTRNTQMQELINENSSIIIGDLNTENVSLLLKNGYIDFTKHISSTYRRDNPLTWNLNFFKKGKDKKLDYILSKYNKIYSVETINLYSDHDSLLCFINSK